MAGRSITRNSKPGRQSALRVTAPPVHPGLQQLSAQGDESKVLLFFQTRVQTECALGPPSSLRPGKAGDRLKTEARPFLY